MSLHLYHSDMQNCIEHLVGRCNQCQKQKNVGHGYGHQAATRQQSILEEKLLQLHWSMDSTSQRTLHRVPCSHHHQYSHQPS